MVHEILVIDVEYDHQKGGTVMFSPTSNIEHCYAAFFEGTTFEKGERCFVAISHLSLGELSFEDIFSINVSRSKKLEQGASRWSYLGYGVIESLNPIVGNFGDIRLEIGEWSQDKRIVGEFIFWPIDRLDVERCNDSTYFRNSD